jgi:UDP-glucose:(heptosyl)LPS alpha-1,3-glucosyltransferase
VADRIRWIGTSPAIEEYYGAADVLVHPTAYDPCSLVVLEAMASGLPVITTRQNGAGELITDGVEGYVLDRGEASALAERCAMLLENDSRRQQAGSRARERALTRSRARHVDEILGVYREALELGITPEPVWRR